MRNAEGAECSGKDFLARDQMGGEMIGAIQIADTDFLLVNADAADRAVAEHEPGVESVGGMAPRQVEDGAHQVHEESAMADECNPVFRLTILIRVAREQF